MSEQGTKHDTGKLPMHLLSFQVLEGIAAVLAIGAAKYDARNWEKGLVYSRPYAAILRHLSAWWQGEDIDKESGLPHLDHAACEIMFLSHFEKTDRKALDDRPCYKTIHMPKM